MNFSGYVGAMTAISMINNHGNNERYKDANAKWTEEDGITDRVKEIVHNLAGNHGKHNHTRGSFIVPSGKWKV